MSVVLRAPEITDVDLLYEIENDPERLSQGRTGLPYSHENIRDYVKRYPYEALTSGDIRFIVDHESKPCGVVDLYDIDHSARRAFVSIYIIKTLRNKGCGSQALNKIALFARDHLGLHQINAVVAVNNTASINLFKKLDFIWVALLKEWVRNNDGKLDNAVLFAKYFH